MKLGNFFYMSGMKVLDYLIRWDYISIKEGGKSDISTHLPTVATESVSKFRERPHTARTPPRRPHLKFWGVIKGSQVGALTERNNMSAVEKEKSCQELVHEQWQERQKDLERYGTDFEGLSFDCVPPHTFEKQPEGYWRWQFSWGGPSDELRAYVNEHREIHRLEYWYLDWGDGAHVLVSQDAEAWSQMQEMIS